MILAVFWMETRNGDPLPPPALGKSGQGIRGTSKLPSDTTRCTEVVSNTPDDMPHPACHCIHTIISRLPLFTGESWRESKELRIRNGIYVFYENEESYEHDGRRYLRIVRIGTHRKQDGFHKRIQLHYRGNKNSSVFRKHIGTALIPGNDPRRNAWAKERDRLPDIEGKVTEALESSFSFRALKVDEWDERKDFEERLIATLSHSPYCTPTEHWLGHRALNNNVRSSGLWNSDFVNSTRTMDNNHLERLEELVDRTISQSPKGKMRRIGLIPCTSKKKPCRCPVREMYSASPTFRKALGYALDHYDEVYILSAKHGLLALNDVIDHYNYTLIGKGRDIKREWSDMVVGQMHERGLLKGDVAFFIHAGNDYRQFLVPILEGLGYSCIVPLTGLRQGEQAQWYIQQGYRG